MGVQIIPTVLANTLEEFNQRLARLLPISDTIQVDLMDGRFVPSTSVALNYLPDMKRWPGKLFEAHLMVQTPGAFIQPLARRGFKRVIIHIETVDQKSIAAVLAQCEKFRMTPILAINPETPVERVVPYLPKVEAILFLGVHPGFNGAPYVPSTPARIRKFVSLAKGTPIIVQVDGGMTPDTIGQVVAAGASRVNSGSYVSNAKEPKKALALLQAAADAAQKPAKSPPTDRAPAEKTPKKRGGQKSAAPAAKSSVQRTATRTRAKGSKAAKRSR